MATLSSDKVTSNLPARLIHAGVYTECARFTGTTAFSAGDVVQMVRVPANARVVGIQLQTNLIATTSAAVLTVGDGIDPNRYISATGTTIGSGFSNQSSALGYEYSADDTVDVTVSTVGADATSAPVLNLYVSMVVDN